ncbi:MAG: hypothetical protein GY750_09490 [Lentisphaerae bacterium]|nr:hypothetical protein [Lentisphaerota bacterium]MCP4101645.1 hypothetical protein [Lentisphaerota bacterium]
MAIKGDEVADFFRQLSLLSKAKLPLPEGIHNMAATTNKKQFKKVLQDLSRDIESGHKLSEAMEGHKELFTNYQIKLVETGEKSGALNDVLLEVANSAKMNSRINNVFRAACLYPAIVFFMTFAVFTGLYYYVVSGFGDIYRELLDGAPLPFLSAFVVGLGDIIHANIFIICGIFIALLLATFWLLSGRVISQRIIGKILSIFPFTSRIIKNLNAARFCTTMSTLMQHNMTDSDSVLLISECINDSNMTRSLTQTATKLQNGSNLKESISKVKQLPSLIAATIKHIKEGELPEHLHELSEVFYVRAFGGLRNFETWSTNLLVIFVSIILGLSILALFAPLANLIDALGGKYEFFCFRNKSWSLRNLLL